MDFFKKIVSLIPILLFLSQVNAKQRSIDELIGNIVVESDTGFIKLSDKYAAVTGTQLFLRNEVAEAFFLMDAKFYKDFGYHLKLNSAFRSFEEQRLLREMFPDLQLRITALPGTSQHHCCAIDIDKNHETRSQKVSPRLQKNAKEFGFLMPFIQESDYDFEQEDWHYAYLPLLQDYKQQYFEKINNLVLDSLNGNTLATKYSIMERYVLGGDFTKVLRKRSLLYHLQQQKKRLQYLSFLDRNTILETGYIFLGSGSTGESFYKLVLDPSILLEYGVKAMLGSDATIHYRYFRRGKNGSLYQLGANESFGKKVIIYVILSGK